MLRNKRINSVNNSSSGSRTREKEIIYSNKELFPN